MFLLKTHALGFCFLSSLLAAANPISDEIMRQVMSEGPGRWVSTGSKPQGPNIIVRGLSGVGWAKGSAAGEWEPFVQGKPGAQDRFVGVAQSSSEIPALINTIAGFYANPFIVAGRVDNNRLTKEIDSQTFRPDHGAWATTDQKQILKKGYSSADFDKIGVLMPSDTFDAMAWIRGYREAAQKFPPQENSRGAEFLRALDVLDKHLKINPHTGEILNSDEHKRAFYSLANLYDQGDMIQDDFTTKEKFKAALKEFRNIETQKENIESDPLVHAAKERYLEKERLFHELNQKPEKDEKQLDLLWDEYFELSKEYNKAKHEKQNEINQIEKKFLKDTASFLNVEEGVLKFQIDKIKAYEEWKKYAKEDAHLPSIEKSAANSWIFEHVSKPKSRPRGCEIFAPPLSP